MPAYWLARFRIVDPVQYKKYTDRIPAILAKYGGKVLARGGRFQIMEGPDKFHRFVVVEFPTLEQGVACFKSREYEEARRSAAMAPAKSKPSSWKPATPHRGEALPLMTTRMRPALVPDGAMMAHPRKARRRQKPAGGTQ
jgi:uncharacterized protein (DUF1330 family)